MLSDAPPSSEDVTTSFTWLELIEVNTLTSSGMTAPASVPHEMIAASFHHSVASPLSVGNHQLGDDESEDDGDNGREPHQRRQRRFKVHVVGVPVAGLGDGFIDEIRTRAGHQHHDAHHENPNQQLHLHDVDRERRPG